MPNELTREKKGFKDSKYYVTEMAVLIPYHLVIT